MTNRLLAPDLYEYLLLLTEQLQSAGAAEAGQQVRQVSKFVSGSTSEFYGESRLLLSKVLQSEGARLTELDRARLVRTIAMIESEFQRIGGA